MSRLFSPITIRELQFRNRIFVSPMCQYSSENGMPTPWHLVHLGSRAIGGAGLVMVEASGVSPEGRITPDDSGIWSAAHAEAFRPLVSFLQDHGAVPAIQLAHAGRKASTESPWKGGKEVKDAGRVWQTVAPSGVRFDDGYPMPKEMTENDIEKVIKDFVQAARYSLDAGFQVIELHFAHGYLVHEFLSPLSNKRKDFFGGSLENRMRVALTIAEKVRAVWPAKWPVFTRISATDYIDGGWDLPQSVVLCKELKTRGIDLIDCSSGGNAPHAKIPIGPGYQVPFSATIRRECSMPTGAVGMITEPEQAERIIATGEADVVLLAREILRDPYWPLHAAHKLGVDCTWPKQYERAKPRL
jgi:2,4-dienoyl-CoA reductase-like NADH-dependent reductase (Old Yellow Enzyme family)